MNNNKLSGKRLSFYKLFCKENYKISIPIIQRDYAQGRQSTAEIRDNFLNALCEYLEEGKANRDLDFIYGSLNNKNEEFVEFIPLDGQQRLTTLFLLHWYLYQISDKTEKTMEFKELLFRNRESMFTYKTRTSSTEFCNKLMSNDIYFNNLLEADEDLDGSSKENRLSKTIGNSSWFFLAWKYDPTVKSMLTMLDAIHNKFGELPNNKKYFDQLTDTENPIITFLFLNLEDFNLADDLYIKMNSRGVQLTLFENFKANFEQHLESMGNFKPYGKEKEYSIKEYFSHNIDTEWSNLFWNYREVVDGKSIEEKNTYDAELRNFIRVIFANQYATISNEKNDKLEFLLGTLVAKEDKKNYTNDISFNKYKDLDAITKESVLFLINAFDNLKNENSKIKTYLSDRYTLYFNENTIFENVLKHSLTYLARLLFHAYIRFLIENQTDRTGIEQWMRVIYNLANNTRIEDADLFSKAIQSIEKLLPYSNNILKYLRQDPKIESFSKGQFLEEKIKAHLIKKGNNWKDAIESTEINKYFAGQIGFILEFSGIVDCYEKNKCDWTEDENKDYLVSFNNYAEKAAAVFNDRDKYKNKDNFNYNFVWERAVLTKGDYLIDAQSSYSRKNLLITNERDFSWKRLLRIKDEKNEKDEKSLASRRMLIKQVFDDILFDSDRNNLKYSLEKICEKGANEDDWRNYLIKCPDLIRYCQKGYMQIKNNHDIILLSQSKMFGKHSEMYTYYLWHKSFIKNKESFKPFKTEYYESKYTEDDACILLNGFCHKGINYEIRIYYCNDDTLPYPYEIAFKKLEGENIPGKYEKDIENILKKLNFEWIKQYRGYFFSGNGDDAIMEKLNKLIEELRELKPQSLALNPQSP